MKDAIIEDWLQKINIPFRAINNTSWMLTMDDDGYSYEVVLINRGIYIQVTSIIQKTDDRLYEKILKINSSINCGHIAILGGNIVLIKNIIFEDTDLFRIYRDLKYFHATHKFIHAKIIKELCNLF